MTLESIKNYLRIDFNDDDDELNDLIEISQIFIDSMVGEEYKGDEKALKLAELLQKKLINDMYESRTMEITSNAKNSLIVISILDKLSLYNWSDSNG